MSAPRRDEPSPTPGASRVVVALTLLIQLWLAVSLVLFITRADWENAFLTLLVIALVVVPAFVLRRYRVHVPRQFQLIAAAFAFLTLYLGSAQDFYDRFWWWDIVLHAGSGFLLGVVGWIVLFLLLHSDRLPRGIGPGLVSVFGVTFAVTLGVIWEIFEFAMDSLWPRLNMMSNETGVTDTMQDLTVDLIGAVIVGVMGWARSKTSWRSFVVDGLRAFLRKNPRLFKRKSKPRP